MTDRCAVRLANSGNTYGPFDSYADAFNWGANRRDGVVDAVDKYGTFAVVEAGQG